MGVAMFMTTSPSGTEEMQMVTTDYPTYDDADIAPLWCSACGRPLGRDEDSGTWSEIATECGPEMQCPHCAALAEAEGLVQAERQGGR